MEDYKLKVRQTFNALKQKVMERIHGPAKEGEMEKKVTGASASYQWGMSMASTPYKVPASGMDRAESMGFKSKVASTPAYFSIGSMERGILGAERSEYEIGGHVLPSRSMFMYEDPSSHDADATTQIWSAQVAASNGFFDGDREVYVNEDAATVWD